MNKKNCRTWFNNKGQGYSEYLIIVSCIGIACITIYTLFGQQIRASMTKLGIELAGQPSGTLDGGPFAKSNNNNPNDSSTFSNQDGSSSNEGSGNGSSGSDGSGSGGDSGDNGSSDEEEGTTVSDYLLNSLTQNLIGQYEDDPNLLGDVAEVTLAFFGLDPHLDAAAIVHGVDNWETSLPHVAEMGLNVASIFPIAGGVIKGLKKVYKYGKKAAVEALAMMPIVNKWVDGFKKWLKKEKPTNTGCFVPGTLILTGDGSAKAIEEIHIGDYVLSELPVRDGPVMASD